MDDTSSIVSLSVPLEQNNRLKLLGDVTRNDVVNMQKPQKDTSSAAASSSDDDDGSDDSKSDNSSENEEGGSGSSSSDNASESGSSASSSKSSRVSKKSARPLKNKNHHNHHNQNDEVTPDESVSVAAFRRQPTSSLPLPPSHSVPQITPITTQTFPLKRKLDDTEFQSILPSSTEISESQLKFNSLKSRIEPMVREKSDKLLMSAYHAEIKKMAQTNDECAKLLEMLGSNPDMTLITFVRARMLEEVNREKYGEGMSKMAIIASKFAGYSGGVLKSFGLVSFNPFNGVDREVQNHKNVINKAFQQMHAEEGALIKFTGRLELLLIAFTCCQSAIERNMKESEESKRYLTDKQKEKQNDEREKREDEEKDKKEIEEPYSNSMFKPPPIRIRIPPPPPPFTPPPPSTIPADCKTVVLHMTKPERDLAKLYPDCTHAQKSINLSDLPETVKPEELLKIPITTNSGQNVIDDNTTDISAIYEE